MSKVSRNCAKEWGLEKETKVYQRFLIEKKSEFFYSFTYIFPDYMAHEITKEFRKNRHFENMTAGFLLRCQKSLRQTTLEIMHFQG